MDTALKTIVWQQFGAAIDMFSDAIDLCPDHLWTVKLWDDEDDPRFGQFWYIAYHTLSWLDLFLTGSQEGFTPPPPFLRGKLPDNPYTKADIVAYLRQCRQKCKATLEALTDEKANQICTFAWMQPTYLELQLYSMRHVQEHGAHLNMVLGQHGVTGQDWVAQVRETVSWQG